MLKLSIILILTISFLMGKEITGPTNTLMTNQSKKDLDHLRRAADFKLLVPTDNSLKNNKIEIKELYSLVLDTPISKVRIHYFEGNQLNKGISELKKKTLLA